MHNFRFFPLLALIILLCTSVRAQGIEFFHGSWDEALAKAQAEDKLIFVDAYASWCGPCKAMARNVFPVAEVGHFYNRNFINMKFDMEKAESIDFRKTHRVSAYPTLLFINADNEVVYRSVGGKQVKSLIGAGNAALTKMDDVDAYAERWRSGERDAKLALKYLRGLVRQQRPHAKVANDYLRSQPDLSTEDNLRILLIAATQADGYSFDQLIKNKAAAVALVGQRAYDDRVRRAIDATLAKAVEFKDEELLAETAKKLAKQDPAAGKRMALRGTYEIAAKGSNAKAFVKAMKKYRKAAADDPADLDRIYAVASSSRFIHDDKVLDLAVEAGASAAAADAATGFRKYYRLADFLLQQDRLHQALTYAKLALEAVPKEQKSMVRAVQGLIKRIEAGK